MNSNSSPPPNRTLLGAAGAAAGGVLGYFAFLWMVRQGLYALIVPAAALGLGAGLGARHQSHAAAAGYGVLGLLITVFCEWRFSPFAVDDGFGYFVTHAHQLSPMKLVMFAVAAVIAYRLSLGVGYGKSRDAADSAPGNS